MPKLNLYFDENIPDLVQSVLSAQGLYPDLESRSRIMADYFGLDAPRIFFGIRSFTGFLPSLFCETLKSTPYQPFSRFYRPDRHRLAWDEVIDRIRRTFPDSPIGVYRAEDLRGNERQLLSHVTGIPPEAFSFPEQSRREGFSHKAVRSLYALSQTRQVTFNDVFAAVREYPKGEKWKGFDPLSDEEKQRLDELYQRDLDRLRARSDIEFIELGAR